MTVSASLPIIASGDWQRLPDLYDYRYDWRNDILVERATWAEAAPLQRIGATTIAAPGYVWFRFWLAEGDHILDKYFDDSGIAIGIYAHVGMGLPHQGRGYSMVDLILGLWITGQARITVQNEARFDAAVANSLITPVEAEHAEHQLREMTAAIAHKRFPCFSAQLRHCAKIDKLEAAILMIAILDYGVGNLRSVYKAFETVAGPLAIPVDIVDKPVDLRRWRAVVLPGQGAFGDSVDNLRRQQLDRPLLDAVHAGLPVLGICVGMQLLFDSSEEMGQHEGLHIIPGAVRRFPDSMADPQHRGRTLRVPQIGWNQLHVKRHDPLLAALPDGAYAYFAHSYYCDAANGEAVLATTDYGIYYPSIVRYRNAWGIQPHPEKSHTVGLRILSNFMRMVVLANAQAA